MNKNDFMETIAPHFNEIKEKFKNNINKLNLEFNEDIFAETIEKCNKKIHGNIKEEEAINYLWKAFRNNTLRALKYKPNFITLEEINEDVIPLDYNIDEDFNNISKLIINKYGDKLYQLFALHASGKPYKELEKITSIKNLKYKFRSIREYIRENYNISYD